MAAPRSPKLAAMLRAAGIDPLGTPPPTLPPGTLIVEFMIPMRPVPWKAATTTRTGHAFKDARLVEWQKTVSGLGIIAMHSRGARPYAGPVRLELEFRLTRRGGSLPDLSNLVKACEDALQDSVIVNDKMVQEIRSARVIGDHDRVTVAVYAMAPQ